MRPAQTLLILLVAALGCQAAPPPDTTPEAKQAIDAANANWPRLTAAGHADSLAQYYHPSAVILPPNMPPMHGRDSIRAFFTVLNTMSSPPRSPMAAATTPLRPPTPSPTAQMRSWQRQTTCLASPPRATLPLSAGPALCECWC